MRWHVVRTEHGQDRSASIEIVDAGFRVLTLSLFLPPEPARRVGAIVRPAFPARVVPLFPSYLLVQFCTADPDWRRINGLPGVDEVLSSAPAEAGERREPFSVPDAAIERIEQLPGFRNGCLYQDPGAPLDVGAAFHLRETVLGDERHICTWSDAQRVRFMTQLFGRDDVPVTVSRRRVVQI